MDKLKNLLGFVKKDDIGEPPWDYDFLLNLDEKDYPKYLKKIFKYRTDEDVDLTPPCGWLGLSNINQFKEKSIHSSSPLQKVRSFVQNRNLQTFNQKIQWLKLYGMTPLKTDCTDKIKVRDFIQEKIGADYLKPIVQICNSFDEIDFNNVPLSFVMKCNHGSKWQFMIDNRLNYKRDIKAFEHTRQMISGWLEQEFWVWAGFEMQYKGIEPKVFIEPLFRDSNNTSPKEIEIYCFNGVPKIFVKVRYSYTRQICVYDENYQFIDLVLHPDSNNMILKEEPDEILKQAVDLSAQLSKDFDFVRVDWLIHSNKLYFNEMTFTPYSGFVSFDKKWEKILGDWIILDNN